MSGKPSEVGRAFIEGARSQLAADYLPKIERCLERLGGGQSSSVGNLPRHPACNARRRVVYAVSGGR